MHPSSWRLLVPLALLGCNGTRADLAAGACQVVLLPNEVMLERSDSGEFAESSGFLTVDSRGNYLSGSWATSQLMQWNADGKLLRVVGRRGEGPGEFGPGMLHAFVTPEDSVFVRDGSLRWLVFDDALNYVRAFPLGPIAGISDRETHFLPGQRIVSTFQRSPDNPHDVLVLNHDGHVVDSMFPSNVEVARYGRSNRSSAFIAPDHLWLAPYAGTGPYRIDIVSLQGSLVDSLLPAAPWFDTTLRVSREVSDAQHGGTQLERFPFPLIGYVSADDDGLVWVWSFLPNDASAAEQYLATDWQRRSEVIKRLVTLRIDVFDASTKAHVASGSIPAAEDLFGPLKGRRAAVRVRVDADGLRQVSVVPLGLVAANGGVCSMGDGTR